MTTPAAPTFSPDQIAAVVREVLRRLGIDGTPLALPVPLAPSTPVARPQSPPAPFVRALSISGTPAIADKVVTGATLAGLPADTKSVTVRHDAVITPSARDRARESGFAIIRQVKGGSAAAAGKLPRPFFVATAECAGDVSGRSASVVRAVPGAQQLPATGLSDVIAALALHASRDAACGVLLAGRPHVATALANRSRGIRAVTARDTATLLAAARECAANLIVVSPRDFSGVSLERVCVTIATADGGPPPAELSAPECGCQRESSPASPEACTCHNHH
ncbi:MAG: hypothetical protein DWH79_10250 [Planctomycetota bacterium]|nr:MAG: hypothetical protein DWH79_10250 [Planctomycetota bacterium]